MLCWIREHDNKEVFLDKISDCNYYRWDLAKGIFLTERQVKSLPERGMPSCPNLTTLLVKAESVRFSSPFQIDKLPTEDFFHFTPSLRVLDLRFTGIVDILKSIGELVELRYLNLYRTRIHMLPMEFGNLKKLKCLDLGDTFELVTIVGSAISRLSMLQSLNLINTKYQWNSDVNMATQPPLLKLEDLKELKNLEDMGMNVKSNSHLNTILGNQILLNSIARICFSGIDFTKEELQLIKLISERLPRLKDLIVDKCALPDILEIKDNHQTLVTQLNLWSLEISSVIMNDGCLLHSLKILQIFNCQCLKEMNWTAHIPSLEHLYVRNCSRVEELVVGITDVEEEIEERDCYFPKLKELKIKGSKNLERIHGRSRLLLFPALRFLSTKNCPKLKQLSLGHDSAKSMEIIKCEQHWWDSLEWENDQVQSRFLRYVRPKLQYYDRRSFLTNI